MLVSHDRIPSGRLPVDRLAGAAAPAFEPIPVVRQQAADLLGRARRPAWVVVLLLAHGAFALGEDARRQVGPRHAPGQVSGGLGLVLTGEVVGPAPGALLRLGPTVLARLRPAALVRLGPRAPDRLLPTLGPEGPGRAWIGQRALPPVRERVPVHRVAGGGERLRVRHRRLDRCVELARPADRRLDVLLRAGEPRRQRRVGGGGGGPGGWAGSGGWGTLPDSGGWGVGAVAPGAANQSDRACSKMGSGSGMT